jgi:CheY-like chemotaxis protein
MTFALVIDDNRQTAEALCQMLRIWKIPSRTALTPSAGMAILREENPSIIFLDINMPGVDGFEVLSFLRREPHLIGVPVIIVTSDDQPETSERGIKGGATAVIIKPVMAEILEEALTKAGII